MIKAGEPIFDQAYQNLCRLLGLLHRLEEEICAFAVAEVWVLAPVDLVCIGDDFA